MSTRKRLLPWLVFLALVAMFVLAYVNSRRSPERLLEMSAKY